MPTPGGMLKPGDVLVYRKPPGADPKEYEKDFNGVRFVVVERTGNDSSYAIWIRREDNQAFRLGTTSRNHGREALLLNAHYFVFHIDYGLELIRDGSSGTPLVRNPEDKLSISLSVESWQRIRNCLSWADEEEGTADFQEVIDELTRQLRRANADGPVSTTT